MEIMKTINCTTPSSNDNSAPMIREPTVPLINNNSKFRATLPSLTEIVFGPYHQDTLENQLEERNNQLEDTCPSDTGCNPQKPDLLSLEDGQKYDIAGLDDKDLKPLLEYARNGTSAEGIPELYKVLAIKE
jgi:hypothetical protein